jgi:hypothetical protein
MARTGAPSRTPPRLPIGAVLGHGDLGTSLLLVFPLFIIYEVGIAFAPADNGVDFVSRNLYALVGYQKSGYLILNGVLALAFLALMWWRRQKNPKASLGVAGMLLESGIYALTLGSLIVFVMQKLLGIEPSLAVNGVGTRVLVSCGAGVYEELVFRLGICAGGAALLRLFGLKHWVAVAFAFLVSSMLFSAAHHLGPAGEPWAFHVFVYRTIAGLIFATVFYYRSLAHACYTHAFYDMYVMIIR